MTRVGTTMQRAVDVISPGANVRVLLDGGYSGARPTLRTRSHDLESLLTGQPVEIRLVLNKTPPPEDPGGDSDPDQSVDEDWLERKFLEEYEKLVKEKTRLDRAYSKLLVRALAVGVPPLKLFDTSKAGDAPIPVVKRIDNLQQHRGDPSWTARSCTWVGESTLYEVTEPSTKSVAAQGRRLVLPSQSFPKSRSDLAAISPNDPDLKYPPGKGPKDRFPPWTARAAESAYSA